MSVSYSETAGTNVISGRQSLAQLLMGLLSAQTWEAADSTGQQSFGGKRLDNMP